MKTYLILLLSFLINFTYAQKITLNFKIDSVSDGTKLYLDKHINKDYYSEIIKDSAIVNNGKIQFLMDKIPFTSPFILHTEVINKTYSSTRPFYIKNKSLTINLNSISDTIKDDITDRINYERYFKDINTEIDNYNNFYGQNFIKYKFDFPKEINDSINNWYTNNWKKEIKLLEEYIKENPKSEIALWKIIEKYERYKDYPYELLLTDFDTNIKESYPFKILMNKINENKIFGYGKVFPVIDNLKTLDNKAYQPNYSKNKYTLIDFWFSSCKPCLITFPKFKEIYSQYHEKGFQIEAISVDTEKYINDWRNTVAKYELPWINVLDESKKFSTKNNINAFPTSFLVNDKGEIIMKDIDPEKLEVFLRENLN